MAFVRRSFSLNSFDSTKLTYAETLSGSSATRIPLGVMRGNVAGIVMLGLNVFMWLRSPGDVS